MSENTNAHLVISSVEHDEGAVSFEANGGSFRTDPDSTRELASELAEASDRAANYEDEDGDGDEDGEKDEDDE